MHGIITSVKNGSNRVTLNWMLVVQSFSFSHCWLCTKRKRFYILSIGYAFNRLSHKFRVPGYEANQDCFITWYLLRLAVLFLEIMSFFVQERQILLSMKIKFQGLSILKANKIMPIFVYE